MAASDSNAGGALTTIGQLAAVVVIAVPGTGALVRCIAFATAEDFGPWIRVGVAASVPELTGFGLQVLFGPFIQVLIWTALAQLGGTEVGAQVAGEIKAAPHLRRAFWVWAGLGLLSVGVASLAMSFPVGLIGNLTVGVLGMWSGVLGGRRQFTVARAWPIVAIAVLVALMSSVAPNRAPGVSAAEMRFADESTLSDGVYVRLGAADGTTFVRPCFGSDRHVTSVRTDQILEEVFVPRAAPAAGSALGIVFGDDVMRVGFRFPCQKR